MRVLHLTAEFPPLIWGGLGTAVGGLALARALCQGERDRLSRSCPSVRRRVRVVANGIDDRGLPEPGARETRGGPVTVLYSGRFVDRKGIRELFAAIPAVLDRAPETRF